MNILATENTVVAEAGPAALPPLLPAEEAQWRECKARIERGNGRVLSGFADIGEGFQKARDGLLYRMEFATFADFCEAYGHDVRQAQRLMKAAKTLANVGLTLGKLATQGRILPLPENERQLREIARLPTAELQGAAWLEVLRVQPDGRAKSGVVAGIVDGYLGNGSPGVSPHLVESPLTPALSPSGGEGAGGHSGPVVDIEPVGNWDAETRRKFGLALVAVRDLMDHHGPSGDIQGALNLLDRAATKSEQDRRLQAAQDAQEEKLNALPRRPILESLQTATVK